MDYVLKLYCAIFNPSIWTNNCSFPLVFQSVAIAFCLHVGAAEL